MACRDEANSCADVSEMIGTEREALRSRSTHPSRGSTATAGSRGAGQPLGALGEYLVGVPRSFRHHFEHVAYEGNRDVLVEEVTHAVDEDDRGECQLCGT